MRWHLKREGREEGKEGGRTFRSASAPSTVRACERTYSTTSSTSSFVRRSH